MKTIAILLVCVAFASAQFGRTGRTSGGLGGGLGGGARGGAGGLNQVLCPFRPVNYGPKVYGPGANNPCARPANPIMMQRALRLANSRSDILIFQDLDGSIEFRNRFGEEAEHLNLFGIDIQDLIEI